MIMLVKAIELTLFPAVMAFAASSDLLTMTIANRVSIILRLPASACSPSLPA